jgi:hypothetical protein
METASMKAQRIKPRISTPPRKRDDTAADPHVVQLFTIITASGSRERAAWKELASHLVKKKNSRPAAGRRKGGNEMREDDHLYFMDRRLWPQPRLMTLDQICKFLEITPDDIPGLKRTAYFPTPYKNKPDRWTENQIKKYKGYLEAWCGHMWTPRELYTRWEADWPED